MNEQMESLRNEMMKLKYEYNTTIGSVPSSSLWLTAVQEDTADEAVDIEEKEAELTAAEEEHEQ